MFRVSRFGRGNSVRGRWPRTAQNAEKYKTPRNGVFHVSLRSERRETPCFMFHVECQIDNDEDHPGSYEAEQRFEAVVSAVLAEARAERRAPCSGPRVHVCGV